MSWKTTGKVWEADLPPLEKLVLLFVADKTNDEGKGCYASYNTIAMKTGLGRRTVIKIIQKLRQQGVLVYLESHKEYRTNVWMVEGSKLPPLPSRQEWLKQKRAADPEFDVDEHTVLNDGVSDALEMVHAGHHQWCTSDTINGAHGAPNPLEYPLDDTGVLNNPLASKVDKSLENGTTNLDKYQHNRDEEYERVPAGEEDGTEKGKAKPRTKLERLICDRTGSLYLSDPMRRKLNARVAAWVGSQERWFPSPEEEMQNHPEAFEWYVNERANMYLNRVGSPPSRQNLVNAVANYKGNTEGKYGWLDFKARWDAGKIVGQKAEQPSPNGMVKHAMWFEE